MTIINEFKGEYYFLSNFYESVVHLDGIECSTVEHAYQAAKTLNIDKRYEVINSRSAGKAKEIGRNLKIRHDWEYVKVNIMLGLLRQKFSNEVLCQKLLDTGNSVLIEGNTWGDTFWGVDLTSKKGKNKLGNLLMQVRLELSVSNDH